MSITDLLFYTFYYWKMQYNKRFLKWENGKMGRTNNILANLIDFPSGCHFHPRRPYATENVPVLRLCASDTMNERQHWVACLFDNNIE